MPDNYDVALAALLTDIGKLRDRAGISKKEEFSLDMLASYVKEDPEIEKIVSEAKKIVVGNSEQEDLKHATKKKNMRLYSIFQNIDIGKKYAREGYYHRLVPIDISDKIFPIKQDSYDVQDFNKEYASLLESMVEELERELGKDRHMNLQQEKERTYNRIYYILERYTTFVPYSTSRCSDVSLFEYLKVRSAIATSLNILQKSGEQNVSEFILLAGDVSGIQSFIYHVTEGEETRKNVSKNLRGKSFFINVFIDFLSKYIIKKLDLTLANILYCGGGTFQLLLPNTEETKRKLAEIELEVQRYLYDRYRTSLGLVLAYIEIDKDGIRDYSGSITRLQEELVKAKNQKFLNIIVEKKDRFFLRKDDIQNACKYCCAREAIMNEIICESCLVHIELGEQLVKDRLKYIVYDFDNEIGGCDIKISFGSMGQVCFFKELDNKDIRFMVENINGAGKYGRLKFVGNTVPSVKGVVASFNDIGPLAEGDDKIAVLKMDIDNLGTIFSTGFKDKNRSIARISTLSRMIDLFFCGYINKICEELFVEYLEKNQDKSIELDNLFYINFSGGDDLVIIGPWDWTITLARRIREELNRFTCHNPNISISAGIYISDTKTPVRITVQEGEKYLDEAKSSEGKDSIFIFGRSFKWSNDKDENYNIEKVVKDGEEYSQWIKEKHLSRGLAHNIMVASKNVRRKGILDFDLIPQIAYSLSRNIRDEQVKRKMIGRLITSKIEDSEIEFIKYPLMFAQMKTRDVKED